MLITPLNGNRPQAGHLTRAKGKYAAPITRLQRSASQSSPSRPESGTVATTPKPNTAKDLQVGRRIVRHERSNTSFITLMLAVSGRGEHREPRSAALRCSAGGREPWPSTRTQRTRLVWPARDSPRCHLAPDTAAADCRQEHA